MAFPRRPFERIANARAPKLATEMVSVLDSLIGLLSFLASPYCAVMGVYPWYVGVV